MKLEDFKKIIDECNEIGHKSGYRLIWDKLPFWLMWATSELGEAWEAWRNNDRESVLEEVVDVFITLFQPIGDIYSSEEFINKLLWKIDKNSKRPYKHGRVNL